MAVITLPATLMPSHYAARPVVMSWTSRSITGKSQTVLMPGSYWIAEMHWSGADQIDQPALEALINSLHAGNVLSAPHPLRPVPIGTLRGSPTVSGAHSQGAESVTVSGTAGATLEAGDIIQIDACNYMVRTKATLAGGSASVAITPPLREDVAGGTAVVWNAPAFYWRVAGESPMVPIVSAGHAGAVAISLEEA